LLVLIFLSTCFCIEWNYEEQGPDVWPHEFLGCNGKFQSPINLDLAVAQFDSRLLPIDFLNYGKVSKWNLKNNAHTLQANQIFDSNKDSNLKMPHITGSDFSTDFHLKQFHFHWGYNDYQGCEHHVKSKKFPLEIHLVHESATNETAVLAFLFEISEVNNTALDGLIEIIKIEALPNSENVFNFSLETILPDLKSLQSYFRYIGSLTTPPCTEGIIWTIFDIKIKISHKQMTYFHKIKMHHNNRGLQNLNHRTIYKSIDDNPLSTANDEFNKNSNDKWCLGSWCF
jgi:carbonic anhydrase